MLSDEQIKHMVGRFLNWRLPEGFNPDGGISFQRECNTATPWPSKREPVGTNLFDGGQAEAMVRHMLEGLPVSQKEVVPVALTYTNYKGETASRTITPRSIWFGSTEWHPEPQYLVRAFDHDKQAERDFALKDFGHPVPAPAGELAIKARVAEFAQAILHGDDEHRGWLLEAADAFNEGKPLPAPRGKGTAPHASALHPSTTPVSAPVGVVEKWPEPGDKMQFLDRNGYDVELEAARKVFTKGQVVTVKKFDLGGWCSSITFEELSGKWNSVMFARSPAVEGNPHA
jgi:hypothetical protein